MHQQHKEAPQQIPSPIAQYCSSLVGPNLSNTNTFSNSLMSNPLDDLIAASAPRDVPSVVDPGPGFPAGASFYDGESISLPVTGGECSVFSITVIERPEETCGGLLKHNETACFKNKRSCRSSHRGDGRITLAEEAVVAVVARNKETIFCVPILPVSFIARPLMDRWLQEKRTKLEWNKRRRDPLRTVH